MIQSSKLIKNVAYLKEKEKKHTRVSFSLLPFLQRVN